MTTQLTVDDHLDDGAKGGVRRWRRVMAWVLTGLAFLFVLFALVAPNELSKLSVGAFVRIPMEGLLGVALIVLLPKKARRIVAAIVGSALGVLTLLKLVDMGFNASLARPFDPVFDWSFFGPGLDFLAHAIGRGGAIAVAVLAVIVAVGVVVLMALSTMRLSRLLASRRTGAIRAVVILTIAWIISAGFGQPIASSSAAALAFDHAKQLRTSLEDQQAYDKEATVDVFRDVPSKDLLTALRGKDVIFAFVESYGRVAVQDPGISPPIDALLDAGTSKLHAAGYESRSAFITSSTSGGGSWLAHSTLQSGLMINNQKRYNTFTNSDRLTLSGAFQRAGWKTVGVVPQNVKEWPEGRVYGYNQYYDAHNVGYRGTNFFYAQMPDQYTLEAFQRNERAKPGRGPVMAEIDLVSSHTPFVPLPRLIDWNDVGDGSIFKPMAENGKKPESVWNDADLTRAAYGESIQYSLNTLISYVQNYGDDNLVLVFLGDHQPQPIVTGGDPNRDVPATIIARDPAVVDRISSWGWQNGLNPGPQAPVWQMNAFRDKFLTTFGPQPPHPQR